MNGKDKAYKIWDSLKDIPVDENDELELDVYYDGKVLFEKGTGKLDTWLYVDSLYPLCIIQGLETETSLQEKANALDEEIN